MMKFLSLIRHLVIGLAAAAAIAIPLWFVIAAFGGKFGAWTPLDAFGHVRGMAGMLVPAALALGTAALVVAVLFRIIFGRANAPGAGGYVAGIAALAVGGVGVYIGQSASATFQAVPPIHDISTDTANPPEFSGRLLERRALDPVCESTDTGECNPVDYAAKVDPRSERPLPEVQVEAYPQIQPIEVSVEPVLAYNAALGAAREMGWRIATESEGSLMFEGTAETFWFGFKDDVVVRVRETETGARVDARSVSRVGVSDLDANAARLEAFSERLRSSLGET